MSEQLSQEELDQFLSATGSSTQGENKPTFGSEFSAAIPRSLGQTVQGVGSLIEDLTPWDNNFIKRYGEGVIERNPTQINSLQDVWDNPTAALGSGLGNAAGFLGPQGVVGAVGKAYKVGKAGMGALQLATAGVPSYGGIREAQQADGQDNWYDVPVALGGAATVGAIENALGLQRIPGVSRMLGTPVTEAGERGFLRGAFSKPWQTGVARGLGVAAGEGAEELVQNPIEQMAAYQNPTTAKNLEETALGGVLGFMGGLGGGGYHGVTQGLRQRRVGDDLSGEGFMEIGKYAPTDLLGGMDRRDAYNVGAPFMDTAGEMDRDRTSAFSEAAVDDPRMAIPNQASPRFPINRTDPIDLFHQQLAEQGYDNDRRIPNSFGYGRIPTEAEIAQMRADQSHSAEMERQSRASQGVMPDEAAQVLSAVHDAIVSGEMPDGQSMGQSPYIPNVKFKNANLNGKPELVRLWLTLNDYANLGVLTQEEISAAKPEREVINNPALLKGALAKARSTAYTAALRHIRQQGGANQNREDVYSTESARDSVAATPEDVDAMHKQILERHMLGDSVYRELAALMDIAQIDNDQQAETDIKNGMASRAAVVYARQIVQDLLRQPEISQQSNRTPWGEFMQSIPGAQQGLGVRGLAQERAALKLPPPPGAPAQDLTEGKFPYQWQQQQTGDLFGDQNADPRNSWTEIRKAGTKNGQPFNAVWEQSLPDGRRVMEVNAQGETVSDRRIPNNIPRQEQWNRISTDAGTGNATWVQNAGDDRNVIVSAPNLQGPVSPKHQLPRGETVSRTTISDATGARSAFDPMSADEEAVQRGHISTKHDTSGPVEKLSDDALKQGLAEVQQQLKQLLGAWQAVYKEPSGDMFQPSQWRDTERGRYLAAQIQLLNDRGALLSLELENRTAFEGAVQRSLFDTNEDKPNAGISQGTANLAAGKAATLTRARNNSWQGDNKAVKNSRIARALDALSAEDKRRKDEAEAKLEDGYKDTVVPLAGATDEMQALFEADKKKDPTISDKFDAWLYSVFLKAVAADNYFAAARQQRNDPKSQWKQEEHDRRKAIYDFSSTLTVSPRAVKLLQDALITNGEVFTSPLKPLSIDLGNKKPNVKSVAQRPPLRNWLNEHSDIAEELQAVSAALRADDISNVSPGELLVQLVFDPEGFNIPKEAGGVLVWDEKGNLPTLHARISMADRNSDLRRAITEAVIFEESLVKEKVKKAKQPPKLNSADMKVINAMKAAMEKAGINAADFEEAKGVDLEDDFEDTDPDVAAAEAYQKTDTDLLARLVKNFDADLKQWITDMSVLSGRPVPLFLRQIMQSFDGGPLPNFIHNQLAGAIIKGRDQRLEDIDQNQSTRVKQPFKARTGLVESPTAKITDDSQYYADMMYMLSRVMVGLPAKSVAATSPYEVTPETAEVIAKAREEEIAASKKAAQISELSQARSELPAITTAANFFDGMVDFGLMTPDQARLISTTVGTRGLAAFVGGFQNFKGMAFRSNLNSTAMQGAIRAHLNRLQDIIYGPSPRTSGARLVKQQWGRSTKLIKALAEAITAYNESPFNLVGDKVGTDQAGDVVKARAAGAPNLKSPTIVGPSPRARGSAASTKYEQPLGSLVKAYLAKSNAATRIKHTVKPAKKSAPAVETKAPVVTEKEVLNQELQDAIAPKKLTPITQEAAPKEPAEKKARKPKEPAPPLPVPKVGDKVETTGGEGTVVAVNPDGSFDMKQGKFVSEYTRDPKDGILKSITGEAENPSTAKKIYATLAEWFGVDTMRNNGVREGDPTAPWNKQKLMVYESVNDPDFPINLKAVFAEEGVQAIAWDGERAVIVANRVESGQELGVILHEVGEHVGLKEFLGGEAKIVQLLAQVERMGAGGNATEKAAVAAAKTRIPKDTPVADRKRELIAYTAEELVKRGVTPTVAKSILGSKFLAKIMEIARGVVSRVLGRNPKNMTGEDLLNILQGSAAAALRSTEMLTKPTKKGVMRSTTAGSTQQTMNDVVTGLFEQPIDTIKEALKTGTLKLAFSHTLEKWATNGDRPLLASAAKFFNLIARKEMAKNKIETEVEKVLHKARSIKDPAIRQAATDFMRESTMEKKWGFKPSWDDTVTVDPKMAKRWEALGTAKDIVYEMHEQMHGLYMQMQNMIEGNVKSIYDADIAAATGDEKTKLEAKKAKMLADMRRMMPAKMDGPFFPLHRQGKYIVVAMSKEYRAAHEANDEAEMDRLVAEQIKNKDLNHYAVEMFESHLASKKALAAYANMPGFSDADGGWTKSADKMERLEQLDIIPWQAVSKLVKAVDASADTKYKESLKRIAVELYLHSVNETSARKSQLGRRGTKEGSGVRGAGDMFQSFASYGQSMAHYLSSLENSEEVSKQIEAMKTEAHNSREEDSTKLYNEILGRYNSVLAAPAPGIIGKIQRFTSLATLSLAPAYYMTNATQPWMFTLPVLGGRFGWTRAADELRKATGQVASQIKLFDPNGNFDIDKLKITSGEKQMLQHMWDNGKLNFGLNTELGKYATGAADSKLGQALRFTDNIMMQVEILNRAAVALAAYRLSKGRVINGMEDLEFVEDVLDTTQGNYAATNAPSMFNTNIGRLALQFRKYQLIQASLLISTAKAAWSGADPKEVAVQRAILGYILGQHLAMVGIGGTIPAMVMSMLGAAAGGDGDDKDWERQARAAIGDDSVYNLLFKGLPTMAGMDISQNIGINKAFSLLPFNDVPVDTSSAEKAVIGALGPGVANGMRMTKGLFKMMDGDYHKGAELVLPRGPRDAMKAWRLSTEGVTSTRGDLMFQPEEIRFLDGLSQAIGLPSNRLREIQRVQNDVYELGQHFTDKAKSMKNDYAKAFKEHDTERMNELRDDWREMNDNKRQWQGEMMRQGFKRDLIAPLKPQPVSTLIHAPQNQIKREQKWRHGAE